MLNFTTTQKDGYTILNVEAVNTLPEELATCNPPIIHGSNGIVLNGRMPLWVCAFLTKFYAATCGWVGVFDPRIENGSAVVVATAKAGVTIGDIIPVTETTAA